MRRARRPRGTPEQVPSNPIRLRPLTPARGIATMGAGAVEEEVGELEAETLAVLSEFLAASTGPDETERVLLAHPSLQSVTIDVALAAIMVNARADGEDDSGWHLVGRRDILQTYRQPRLDRAPTQT